MNSRNAVGVGSFGVIPLLFSLFAFSGAFYAACLILKAESAAVVGTRWIDLVASHTASLRSLLGLEAELQRCVADCRALQNDLESRRGSAHALRAGESRPQQLESLVDELAGLERRFAAANDERASILARQAAVQDQTDARGRRRRELEQLRMSNAERQATITALQAQIAQLQRRLDGVARVTGGSNVLDVRNMVPAGSARTAVFADCTEESVRLLPDDLVLSARLTPDDQKRFLEAAGRTGYVVLLMRPRGDRVLAKYLELLQQTNRTGLRRIDYGYEPIESHWQIEVPR